MIFGERISDIHLLVTSLGVTQSKPSSNEHQIHIEVKSEDVVMTTSWCSNKAARKVIPGLLNRAWDAFLHTKKYICIWSRGSWLTPKKEAEEEEEEEETTKVWSQWKETTLRVECTQAALWLDSRRMTKKEPNHLKSLDHCSRPSYFLFQAHSPHPEGVFSWPFGLWILWYKLDMVKCLDLPENCWWHLLWHHLTATPRA